MTITNKILDVAIVGGGITGLAAAAALPQQLRWALFESHHTLGGKVATQHEHVPSVGNFLLEQGPDCLLTAQAASIVTLLDQLGLSTQILPTSHANLPVFVWHNNKATALPHNTHLSIPTQLGSLWRCPLMPLRSKLRMCLEPFMPKGRPLHGAQDESVGHFLQRRLGKQAVDHLAEPLLGNIFQLHPNQQSLLATLPHVYRAFIKHGSVLLGMRAQMRAAGSNKTVGFITLRNGMGSWIQAWARALGPHRLHTHTRIHRLQSLNSGGYALQTDTGQQWHCRCVLLTVPAQQAASILQQVAPPASQQLQALPTTSSASVYLAFANQDLHTATNGSPAAHAGTSAILQGAGLLVPHRQARTVNALTCASRKFAHRAPAGYTLLRAAVGGWRNPTLLQHNSEQTICQQALADVQLFLNTTAQPVLTRLFAWRNSMPQHPVGHVQRMQRITSCLPAGIFVAGSPYGSASLPSCVSQGRQAAQQLQEHLQTSR